MELAYVVIHLYVNDIILAASCVYHFQAANLSAISMACKGKQSNLHYARF